jgi:hypothetical protein
VTKTSAQLNGYALSTTGDPGSYFITYGPSPAHGHRTPTRSYEFTARQSVSFAELVDGLQPGTTYYYSVCAEDTENQGDPYCSPNQTFTTDREGTQRFTTADSPLGSALRNQGWWSPTVTHHTENVNHLAGSFDGDDYRDYFTFHLSSACQATSVTFQLSRFHQTGPLTYSLFDVSTPAEALNADGTSQTIFDDLGTGTTFGSYSLDPGAQDDVLSLPLNSSGVAAVNAAKDQFLSIGGRSSGEGSSEDSFVFGGSNYDSNPSLLVECAPGQSQASRRTAAPETPPTGHLTKQTGVNGLG